MQCILCGSDNVIALCELVCEHILDLKPLDRFHHELIGHSMDFWFLYAYECQAASLDELPEWLSEILNVFISYGVILRYEISNAEEDLHDAIFAFPNYNRYLLHNGDWKLDDVMIKEISMIVDKTAKNYIRDRFEEDPDYLDCFDAEQRVWLTAYGWI